MHEKKVNLSVVLTYLYRWQQVRMLFHLYVCRCIRYPVSMPAIHLFLDLRRDERRGEEEKSRCNSGSSNNSAATSLYSITDLEVTNINRGTKRKLSPHDSVFSGDSYVKLQQSLQRVKQARKSYDDFVPNIPIKKEVNEGSGTSKCNTVDVVQSTSTSFSYIPTSTPEGDELDKFFDEITSQPQNTDLIEQNIYLKSSEQFNEIKSEFTSLPSSQSTCTSSVYSMNCGSSNAPPLNNLFICDKDYHKDRSTPVTYFSEDAVSRDSNNTRCLKESDEIESKQQHISPAGSVVSVDSGYSEDIIQIAVSQCSSGTITQTSCSTMLSVSSAMLSDVNGCSNARLSVSSPLLLQQPSYLSHSNSEQRSKLLNSKDTNVGETYTTAAVSPSTFSIPSVNISVSSPSLSHISTTPPVQLSCGNSVVSSFSIKTNHPRLKITKLMCIFQQNIPISQNRLKSLSKKQYDSLVKLNPIVKKTAPAVTSVSSKQRSENIAIGTAGLSSSLACVTSSGSFQVSTTPSPPCATVTTSSNTALMSTISNNLTLTNTTTSNVTTLTATTASKNTTLIPTATSTTVVSNSTVVSKPTMTAVSSCGILSTASVSPAAKSDRSASSIIIPQVSPAVKSKVSTSTTSPQVSSAVKSKVSTSTTAPQVSPAVKSKVSTSTTALQVSPAVKSKVSTSTTASQVSPVKPTGRPAKKKYAKRTQQEILTGNVSKIAKSNKKSYANSSGIVPRKSARNLPSTTESDSECTSQSNCYTSGDHTTVCESSSSQTESLANVRPSLAALLPPINQSKQRYVSQITMN